MGIKKDTFLKLRFGGALEPYQDNYLLVERNIPPLFPLIPVSALVEEFLLVGWARYIQSCTLDLYIDAYSGKPSYAMLLNYRNTP